MFLVSFVQANQCRDLFSKHQSFSGPKPEVRYDVEIAHKKVRDQGCFHSCWAQVTATLAEMSIGKKISTNFLYRNHINSQLIGVLDNPSLKSFKKNQVSESGELWKGIALAQGLGLRPLSDQAVERSFYTRENKKALYKEAQELVNSYKKDRFSREEAIEGLNRILDKYFGPLKQENFDWQDLSWTPVRWARRLFPERGTVKRFVSEDLWKYRDEEYKSHEVKELSVYDHRGMKRELSIKTSVDKVSLQSLLKLIENKLKVERVPVFVSFGFPKESRAIIYDRKKGVLGVPSVWQNKEVKLDGDIRHAVVVSGIKYDSSGQISGLKVLNSYGTSDGNNGVYWMTRSFFERYLFDVVIYE